MAKYLARSCPTCRSYLGIIIEEPTDDKVQPICGRCATCGYQIDWALNSVGIIRPQIMDECICNHGWVCEDHLDKPWQHDGCDAAGSECLNPECDKDPNSIFAKIHCSTEDE